MPKYEVYYTTATPDDPIALDPDRFYCLASYDTYEEAEERVRDDLDYQYQMWSAGVDVDEYGQPLFIDCYQIRDENGKEIDT